ncbi:MAG: hypothetical protein MHMPM18_000366 [Marteilia pararefringens]
MCDNVNMQIEFAIATILEYTLCLLVASAKSSSRAQIYMNVAVILAAICFLSNFIMLLCLHFERHRNSNGYIIYKLGVIIHIMLSIAVPFLLAMALIYTPNPRSPVLVASAVFSFLPPLWNWFQLELMRIRNYGRVFISNNLSHHWNRRCLFCRTSGEKKLRSMESAWRRQKNQLAIANRNSRMQRKRARNLKYSKRFATSFSV